MSETMLGYLRLPAAGVRIPPKQTDWADPDVVTLQLEHAGFGDVTIASARLPWRFDSRADMTAFFLAHSPAHVRASAMAAERSADMFAAIERLATPDNGPVDVDAGYALATARRGLPAQSSGLGVR